MSKIIVFSLFHWQNFVVPTEHVKEIKYIDARSQTCEMQTSDTGIIILFVFGRYRISLCLAETRKISRISHSLLRFSKKRLVFWSFHVNWTFLLVMQCISSFNKNSLLWLSTLAFIPICNWIHLPYLEQRFPPAARLVRMCWIASKTSTWNKPLKWQKKRWLNQFELGRCIFLARRAENFWQSKNLCWRPNFKTWEPAGPKVFFLKLSPA